MGDANQDVWLLDDLASGEKTRGRGGEEGDHRATEGEIKLTLVTRWVHQGIVLKVTRFVHHHSKRRGGERTPPATVHQHGQLLYTASASLHS